MNDMARRPTHSGGLAPTEAAVRPKVMRRPARFTGTSHTAEILPITPRIEAQYIALPPEQSELPSPKTWQDDVRFGIIMFLMLIAINVLVSMALQPDTTKSGSLVEKNMLVPSPVAAGTDKANDVWNTRPFVHVLDNHAQPIGQ